MENTSGQGAAAHVPPDIDRWNWGAFLLSWIWGIGNHTFIALLMFVPLVNLVMPFVLGARGSAWAWRNKRWESVEAFRSVQRKWAIWGVIVLVGAVVLSVALFAGIFFATTATMKRTEAYAMAVARLQADPEAVRTLGTPIASGAPMGSFRVSGPDGEASLSFAVEGPRDSGKVYLQATKALGQWTLDQAVLEMDATGRRIDLVD